MFYVIDISVPKKIVNKKNNKTISPEKKKAKKNENPTAYGMSVFTKLPKIFIYSEYIKKRRFSIFMVGYYFHNR